MHSFLYFIVIYMKVEESLSELQQFELKSIIFNTVKLEPTLPGSGSSLLHMACYSNTRVDDFHTNDVVSFPSLEAVKLLIETGAEV